MTIAQTYHCS